MYNDWGRSRGRGHDRARKREEKERSQHNNKRKEERSRQISQGATETSRTVRKAAGHAVYKVQRQLSAGQREGHPGKCKK